MKPDNKHQSLLRSIRKLFVAAPFAESVDLKDKKIIVTGASPGSLGFETARILASWGASVVITTRSAPEAAAGALVSLLPDTDGKKTIEAYPLDLSKADSVERFASWYMDTHGKHLDVLINNAGIHLDLLSKWKEPQLSDDGFEIQWRTNYLGTTHLTHLLLPLLKAAGLTTGDARVVNVVSQLHSKGSNEGLLKPPGPYNSWVAYGLSKLALVHSTFELQRLFSKEFHVQAYCLHPGAVFTNIAGKGLKGNRFIETVRNALAPIEAFFLMTPEEGAQTQIYCATHPNLQGGLYYKQCKTAKASKDTKVDKISVRLWEETEAWVSGLK
jgi:retinol dehydrogenase-12